MVFNWIKSFFVKSKYRTFTDDDREKSKLIRKENKNKRLMLEIQEEKLKALKEQVEMQRLQRETKYLQQQLEDYDDEEEDLDDEDEEEEEQDDVDDMFSNAIKDIISKITTPKSTNSIEEIKNYVSKLSNSEKAYIKTMDKATLYNNIKMKYKDINQEQFNELYQTL